MIARSNAQSLRRARPEIADITEISALTDEVIARHERRKTQRRVTLPLNSQPRVEAHRVVNDLSHDLRQPLTMLTMNLQSAIRLLQLPAPRLEAAIEALTDCLGSEQTIVQLLESAQRRFVALVSPEMPFPLDELAKDIVATTRAFEPNWRGRLVERFAKPAPLVEGGAWVLRMPLFSLMRRALAYVEEYERRRKDPLVLGIRLAGEQAELTLEGLHSRFALSTGMKMLIELTTNFARGVGGSTSLHVDGARAAVVVSIPVARPISDSLNGGDHGD